MNAGRFDRSDLDHISRSEFADHLREIVGRWKPIVAVTVAVTAAVAYLAYRTPDQYEAEASLRATVPGEIDDGSTARFRAEQAAELATTQSAFARAAAASGLDLSPSDVAERVEVGLRETPGFVVVTATAESPTDAETLAAAVATLIEEDARDRGVQVVLVDPARAGETPVSGSPAAAVGLAALASAILAAEALIAVRKVRGRLSPVAPEADIRRILGLPAVSAEGAKGSESLVPFFARALSDRPVVTVVQRGRVGDARVAAALGVVAGRFHRRVLMVDADTNGATLHDQFSLARSPGLAEVLEGSTPLRESLRRVDDHSPAALLAAGSPTLDTLTGAARIEATEQVIVNAGADAAIVSITAGSSPDDALVCVHQFPSAVVLVVDPAEWTSGELTRLADQFRSVGGRLVGVITAAARSGPLATV